MGTRGSQVPFRNLSRLAHNGMCRDDSLLPPDRAGGGLRVPLLAGVPDAAENHAGLHETGNLRMQ